MKKKIGDLTLKEVYKICSTNQSMFAITMAISVLANIKNIPIDIIKFSEKDLDKEIEVN